MTKTAPPIKKMFCCVSGWVSSTLLDLFPQLAPDSGQAWQHQMRLPHCLPVFLYWRSWTQEAPAVSSPGLTSACSTPKHWLHPCSTAATTPALLACKVVDPGAQALGVTSPAPWRGSSSRFLNPLLLFLFSFPYAGWRSALMCTTAHLTYASPCNEMQS